MWFDGGGVTLSGLCQEGYALSGSRSHLLGCLSTCSIVVCSVCGCPLTRRACTATVCEPCGDLISDTSKNVALGVAVAVGLALWWFLVWQPYFARESEEAQGKCCGSERLGDMYFAFTTRVAVFAGKFLDLNVMAFFKVSPKP